MVDGRRGGVEERKGKGAIIVQGLVTWNGSGTNLPLIYSFPPLTALSFPSISVRVGVFVSGRVSVCFEVQVVYFCVFVI